MVPKKARKNRWDLSDLFKHNINFSEVLKVTLDILKEVLQDLLFLTAKQIGSFIDNFIIKLPKHFA